MSLENPRLTPVNVETSPESEVGENVYEAMKQRYTTDTYGGDGFPEGTERFVTRKGSHFTCTSSADTVEFHSCFKEALKGTPERTFRFSDKEELFQQLDDYLLKKGEKFS